MFDLERFEMFDGYYEQKLKYRKEFDLFRRLVTEGEVSISDYVLGVIND